MCGADISGATSDATPAGSPPRVRSRRHRGTGQSDRPGITSACAEQTVSSSPDEDSKRDHLRVCGADFNHAYSTSRQKGSPPRVRSRHLLLRTVWADVGITSACAEQTLRSRLPERSAMDHLRVCGADDNPMVNDVLELGSPPRVRSRLIGLRSRRSP